MPLFCLKLVDSCGLLESASSVASEIHGIQSVFKAFVGNFEWLILIIYLNAHVILMLIDDTLCLKCVLSCNVEI